MKQLYLGLANELIVDNFAGGGGASLGIEMAVRRSVDIAVNHDREAVAMHKDNHPQSEPMPTVTSGGQHIGEVRAFLIKYYGTDQDPQLREPMHTVTTKQRFGIVTVKGEDYVIADIGMRMLQPRELYRAQGFPDSYIIDPMVDGSPLTKTAQVRMCGNSVSPLIAKALVEANLMQQEQLDNEKVMTA